MGNLIKRAAITHWLELVILIIALSAIVVLKSMTASVEAEIAHTKGRIAEYEAQIESYGRQPAPARYIPLTTTTTVLPTEREQMLAETVEEWRYELTGAEVNLVAWVTYFEDNSDNNSRTSVAEVVLNRLESDKFPDTVTEVLYAPKQFQVIRAVDKRVKNGEVPPEENIAAVLAVFRDGESIVPEALFFAEKSVKPWKIAKWLYEIGEYGETVFYGQR